MGFRGLQPIWGFYPKKGFIGVLWGYIKLFRDIHGLYQVLGLGSWFPQMRGTLMGVPTRRILEFAGLYWGPLFLETTIYPYTSPIPIHPEPQALNGSFHVIFHSPIYLHRRLPMSANRSQREHVLLRRAIHPDISLHKPCRALVKPDIAIPCCFRKKHFAPTVKNFTQIYPHFGISTPSARHAGFRKSKRQQLRAARATASPPPTAQCRTPAQSSTRQRPKP